VQDRVSKGRRPPSTSPPSSRAACHPQGPLVPPLWALAPLSFKDPLLVGSQEALPPLRDPLRLEEGACSSQVFSRLAIAYLLGLLPGSLRDNGRVQYC